MIEKIDNDIKPELLSFLREQPVLNIYGLSYAEGYPLDDRFYKAYKCDSGFFILLENIAFIYADLNDELYEFMNFMGIDYIYSFCQPNEMYLSDKAVIMSIDKEISCKYIVDNKDSSDREVYELLCQCFEYMPNYESYRNTRIEQRHYLQSFTSNIFKDKSLVSTATVGMQNSLSGLISCVATAKNYRGKGYGSAVVASVANALFKCSKVPVIISNEKKVIDLYSKLGFNICSDMYISTKK